MKVVKFILIISSFWILFSYSADAQTLFYSSAKSSYQVGESFVVPLILNTEGRQINTVTATLDVPLDKLDLLEVRHGSSIISLWVQTPQVDRARGLVTFSGGIPGGYNGSNGPILNLVFRAKRSGTGSLFFQNADILLNDGQGTKVEAKLPRLTLTIKEAAKVPVQAVPQAEEEKPVEFAPDTVPPETFMPLVSRHPSIEDNKYFISFFAVDKDSGIARYEVKEEARFIPIFSTEYMEAKSPYVIQYQRWPTKVHVRAYDQAGNFVDASAIKPMDEMVALILAVVGAAVGGLAVYLATRRTRKTPRRKTV